MELNKNDSEIANKEQIKNLITASPFIILLFFIPMSLFLKSLALGLCLLALIIIPSYRKEILTQYLTPLGLITLAFFGDILLACLWSHSPASHQWEMIRLYSKVLFLPILAIGYRNRKVRFWSLNAYLVVIMITCIISILKSKGIQITNYFTTMSYPNDAGHVFFDHIMTGYMVAFASYLAALFTIQYKNWVRVVYLCLFLLYSYQLLFTNTGRTGYIIYFVLITLLLGLKLSYKHSILGITLFCATVGVCYHESQVMQERTQDAFNDLAMFRQNQKETSLGLRYEFHQYSKSLFIKHPIIGIGTGGFMYQFYLDDPVPSFNRYLLDPNSQYWLILAEQGLIGLILFLFFLGALFFYALRLKENQIILLGLVISFAIGCFSDTILCYSVVGYLLIAVSALCLGELKTSGKESTE